MQCLLNLVLFFSSFYFRRFEHFLTGWLLGLIGNVIGRINKVNHCWAWLVLGWVIISRWVNHLVQPFISTQPGHPLRGSCSEHQRKLELIGT